MRRLAVLTTFTLLASVGCASLQSGPSDPPSVDVTGTRVGSWTLAGGIAGYYMLHLRQTGADVSGEAALPGNAAFSGPIEGRVAGNELIVKMKSGVTGAEFMVAGNELRGFFTATGARLFLQRQK